MALKERVDAAIGAALVDRIVGCVVLVRREGELVYARAAGFADREAGRPMTRDAIFRLASVTKPIVATAALRMIDLGLLGLDDPVTRFLPWFTPRAPDGTSPPISIRQLLSHSSGVSYALPAEVAGGLPGRSFRSRRTCAASRTSRWLSRRGPAGPMAWASTCSAA